jgi:hypothetical protein
MRFLQLTRLFLLSLQLMGSRDLHLSAVRHVVLDEVTAGAMLAPAVLLTMTLMQVDTLFDPSFKTDTQAPTQT